MNYYFGSYEITTSRTLEGNWFFPDWEFVCHIYYNTIGISTSPIASGGGFKNEAQALEWAKNRIKGHKEALKSLSNV